MSAAEAVDKVIPNKPFFTRKEVAEIACLTEQGLADMAAKKRGPVFTRRGKGGGVLYPRTSLVSWLSAEAVTTAA